MTRAPRPFLVTTLLALTLLAACSGTTSASASRRAPVATVARIDSPRRLHLHGTYSQPALTVTGLQQTGGQMSPFTAVGGTVWKGDLDGQTSFVMRGIVNLQTFASKGTIHETYTGSVDGVGAGTLVLQESFNVTAEGHVTVDAAIVSGGGALAHLRGRIIFTGTSDLATGAGNGTYVADLTVRAA